ncbi:hypothetical protein P9112_004776 [Eukaryota sp. TZLM1-RC]
MTQTQLNNKDSLLAYDKPILVSSKTKPSEPISQTQDILNSILPPREYEEDNQLWIQYVSSAPATRLEVVQLQQELDNRLKARQALDMGICPIRREVYSQVFDELIRQVTVNCSERGLLLLRVRDELKMTCDAYETLYESAVAYGLRKALEAQQQRGEIEARVKEVEEENESLSKQLADLRVRSETVERRMAEQKHAAEQKFQEEISCLKKTNMQLKSQLEQALASRK